MTQITADQERELRAMAERALAKLRACVDDLPDDERAVLAAVLEQVRGADDTAGYFVGLLPRLGVLRTTPADDGGEIAINSVDWGKVAAGLRRE